MDKTFFSLEISFFDLDNNYHIYKYYNSNSDYLHDLAKKTEDRMQAFGYRMSYSILRTVTNENLGLDDDFTQKVVYN